MSAARELKKIPAPAKYRLIYRQLAEEIAAGRFTSRAPFPSERVLKARFNVARETIRQALQALQADGLIQTHQGRVAVVVPGAGTMPSGRSRGQKIGVLLADGTRRETFARLSDELRRQASAARFELVFGEWPAAEGVGAVCAAAEALLKTGVVGLLFQPSEEDAQADLLNHTFVQVFARSRVPVLLLDADLTAASTETVYDHVGVDDYRAGYVLARHLRDAGARQIRFLAVRPPAESLRLRFAGAQAGAGPEAQVRLTVAEPAQLAADPLVDAVICPSDRLAAVMVAAFRRCGRQVPGEVQVTGFNDVAAADDAGMALTTVRRPCGEIARLAFLCLRERLRQPEQFVRKVLLQAPLIVRRSTRLRKEKGNPDEET